MSQSPEPSWNPGPTGLQRNDRAPGSTRRRTIAPELQAFDATPEADYLERLAADRDLITVLQLGGFDMSTSEWRQFATALAEYGYGVFRAWLGTGEIVRRLAARTVRGRNELPSPFALSEDHVQELSAELIIQGIVAFRESVLLQGRWQADGGATLKTYFVGHLLFMVPTTFRRWRRAAGRDRAFDPNEPPADTPGSGTSGMDRAELRLLLDAITTKISPKVALMFELQARGWPVTDIAARTGESEANVKTLMMRARTRLARLFPEAHEWIS